MSTSRPYRSELREQQAEQTRVLIAAAARARFLERGWAGTTVRSVAEEAGVSEATVYHVYGSKAGLAGSLLDAAEQAADVRRAAAELREHVGDPVAQLRTFVAFDRRLFELGGDVLRTLAEGRRQHPALGTAYDEGLRRGARERRTMLESWPDGTLAPGLDVDHALARYALLVNLEAFTMATQQHGWTPEETEDWWRTTLEDQLLARRTS